MKYLLDTCVISDFVRGEKNTLNHLKKISPTDIAISSITIMEIRYGMALNPKHGKKLESVIRHLLDAVTVLDFTRGDAEHAARIRADLKQLGTLIGRYDVLLAGAALNNQLILVSSNVSEFNRVDGVVLENWRILPA